MNAPNREALAKSEGSDGMIPHDKIVFVSGLERCGTSMVMKMLHRAGCEIFAQNHASYEHDALKPGANLVRLRPSLMGRVAKLLSPQLAHWPPRFSATLIWLNRNHEQQAKSQVKFLQGCGINVPVSAWRQIAASLPKETEICFELFHRVGVHFKCWNFEEILAEPQLTAGQFCQFINLPSNTVRLMAMTVLRRNADCAPDLAIELQAIEDDEGFAS